MSVDEYRRGAAASSLVAVVFLVVFVALPTFNIIGKVFDWHAMKVVVTDSSLRHVIWFTTWQSLLSTVTTGLVSLPIVWALSRGRFTGHRVVSAIVTMPFVMPTVVVAIALRNVLPGDGSGIVAIIVAHVLFNVAVFVRVVVPRWLAIDPHLEDAARTLGADSLQVFRTTVWPKISTAWFNATCIVAGFTFTSFGVITILGTPGQRTIEVEILRRALNFGDTDSAIALSVVQIVVVGALLSWGSSRSVAASTGIASSRLDRMSRRSHLAVTVIAFASSLLVLAPFVSLFVRSVVTPNGISTSGWTHLFDGSLEKLGVNIGDAFVHSITFAALCAAISVPLALAISSAATYWPERMRIIEYASFIPLVISAVTLGLGVIITFDSAPIEWRSSWWMLPTMHAVIAIPLCVRTLSPALQSVDRHRREAAAVLGASPVRRWWDVDIRTSRRAIASAAALSIAVSLGEFGATSFLTRSDTQTLPIAVSRLIGHIGDVPQNSAYALASLMALSVVVVMIRA